MILLRSIALGIAVIALVACGSQSPTSTFLVYDRDDANGTYRLMESTIETLSDVGTGRGEVATLRAGGALKLELSEPTTEDQWRDLLTIEGDGRPAIQYVVDDGVVVPWDFDSLMMLTLYHHIERAVLFFESYDIGRETVGCLPVYYFAQLELFLLPVPLLTDNAAYIVTLDAFLIPPRFLLDDVPLFANRGVIVHEYSHALFNRLVHDDRRVPRYFLEDWPTIAVNEMRSLDEGVADFMAAIAVGDPDFIRPSVPDDFELDRDISIERFYDTNLLDQASNDDMVDYDPYPLGSVVASALWSLAATLDAQTVVPATLRALDASSTDAAFRLTRVVDGVVDELPAVDRPAACQLFRERLVAVEPDLGC